MAAGFIDFQITVRAGERGQEQADIKAPIHQQRLNEQRLSRHEVKEAPRPVT
jgi:hypothetical protein